MSVDDNNFEKSQPNQNFYILSEANVVRFIK